MEREVVRTSIDLPRELHRKLHERAARSGCSARRLILQSIERAVAESAPRRRRRRLKLEPPIVPSTGKPINFTEQELYELAELP